jgi:hypothetical protein
MHIWLIKIQLVVCNLGMSIWVCVAVVSSDYFGSPRRCGGQGDVLSGW